MKKSILISIIMLLIISVNISSFADMVPASLPTAVEEEEEVVMLGETAEAEEEISKEVEESELPGKIVNSSFIKNFRTSFLKMFSNAITVAKNAIAKILEGFDIEVEEAEEGLKLKLGFNYDGNLIKIESENEGIISFDGESMTLKANGNGDTTLNIKVGEKVIPVNVSVENGEVSLEPQESGVTFNGAGTATFSVDDKNVKVDADTTTTAGITENGLEADMEASQNVEILDKIKLNLNENAGGKISTEGVEANANADASAKFGSIEIANGEAEVEYNNENEDPTVSLNAETLSKKLVNINKQVIPIFSTIKNLFKNLLEK